ncbi:fungal-specific transcription factor domain-containing protein, partial [Cytidiella melzeri]
MKCDFPKNENTCRRCRSSGHHCIVEGRKPRNTPNKREYLLAQIRQKDSIIESLLKQLHNPYVATPLSIASYRNATSPSDQNKQSVLTWLDRLQDSVRTAGRSGGLQAFNLDSRAREGTDGEEESESEAEEAGEPTERGSVGTVKVDEEERQQLLPDTAVPLGLIADLSISNTKKTSAKGDDDTDDDNVVSRERFRQHRRHGVANETYFLPGPAYDLDIRANLIEQHSPPDILVHGLVTPEDVDRLFEIFFARLNVHVSVLDPVLHTPSTTFARCPFLFTVVCAVASRYYAEKSEIYPIAMHFAKHAAANALITGWKSVELAQAYIILSIYGVPARRWEEDRGWLYTGLAIRIATDLNLHHVPTTKPTSERHEREIMNRIRVWLNCYNLDKSTATQFGKPSTIKEDFIVRRSEEWYKKSEYNHIYDIGLCAYTSQLRIMASFHEEVYSDSDAPNGLNERLDFREVTARHDEHLTNYYNEWKQRFEGECDQSGK